MIAKAKRISTVLALLVVFSILQVYVGLSFAAPKSSSSSINTPPLDPAQQVMGSLTTQDNKPVSINGGSATSGATVLTGANIETPADVSATVHLAALGSLQIDPNAKLTLDFTGSSIRVLLLQGCIVLNASKGTAAEIDTTQGVQDRSDGTKDSQLKACAPGSVAAAPATASGGHGGLFGLGTAATVAIIGGGLGTVAAVAASRGGGGNPSPSTP